MRHLCWLPMALFIACDDGTADPAAAPRPIGKGDGAADGCATLTVVPLDIWAQPLRAPTVSIADQSTEAVELCASSSFAVAVDAPFHHAFAGALSWSRGALTVKAGGEAAWVMTRDGADWTLWVGLAHRWFAASGRPARHGNDARLLMDGEEAWSAVASEVGKARDLVTASSWWWTSDLELTRDAATHATSTEAQRQADTVLALLERSPADKKVMVGQFIGQDGLFSNLTVDDGLLAHAEDDDDFEYMGEANPARGKFQVALPAIDFATRVDDAFAPDGEHAGDSGLAPYRGPIAVDASVFFLLDFLEVSAASWHQKFWTIDQKVAFVGGMNAKTTDWDTSAHRVFEPRRMKLDADADARAAVADKLAEPDFGPRKDYMIRLAGPAAIDAVEVFHRRWERQRQSDNELAAFASGFALAAPPAEVATGVDAQVIATMPAPLSENAILESLLRAVSQAERYLYIEDQYFRAPLLYDAIQARMDAVPGLVLVVVTKPVSEWVDPGCWQTAIAYQRFRDRFPGRFRSYQLRAFDVVRTDCTLCRDETEAHFVDIDTHSKIVIIDDTFLEVGSCNSNNRGLLYEGELAVAVVDPTWVAAQRKRIFSNLLGAPTDVPATQILARLDAAAAKNQAAYDAWQDEGMDIDLDGDPMPAGMTPTGFLYPLAFGPAADCAIEDVSPDGT